MNRATPMPASMSFPSVSSSQHFGPIVQTMFVLRVIGWSSMIIAVEIAVWRTVRVPWPTPLVGGTMDSGWYSGVHRIRDAPFSDPASSVVVAGASTNVGRCAAGADAASAAPSVVDVAAPMVCSRPGVMCGGGGRETTPAATMWSTKKSWLSSANDCAFRG